MRFITNVLFLLALSLSLQAQVSLENLSLKDTKVKEMYKGKYNIIQINSNDTSVLYNLTAKHSKISEYPFLKNTFLVYNYSLGQDTLHIVYKDNIIKTECFDTKKCPNAKPWIGFPRKTEISLELLLKNPKIYLFEPSLNLKQRIAPIGFEIIIKDPNDKIIFNGQNRSFTISKDNLEIIRSLNKNLTLIFNKIRFYPSPDCGGARVLPPFKIKII